jgi:hypothetical protein
MVDPGFLTLNRKCGNPNWGRPIPPSPALATEFELRVKRLELTPEMYTSSAALRGWCMQNKGSREVHIREIAQIAASPPPLRSLRS